MCVLDTPGSGRVYDQGLSSLGLGGLVNTCSGAEKTKTNYYLKHKRTLMSVPRYPPLSRTTSCGTPRIMDVVRAGIFFVWQLLRLTDFHKIATSKKLTRRVVLLAWEFHSDIAFCKWATEQKLVSAGESLGAPCHAHVQRTLSRRYYSDASFTVVGGFCPELHVCWTYDLNFYLIELLRNRVETKGVDAITINLLKHCGMMTTHVTQVVLQNRPKTPG